MQPQPKSFKQMVKDGEIKRADAMKVRLQDIHEEKGFNLRREGEDLAASVEALADYIATGGILPPLEVRPRAEGGVFLVDGHRRARAFRRCLERGAAIADASGEVWINVVAFTGNDADRVARIITSAEGRSLSPLEIADGYRRLLAFKWTPDDIAAKVGKTRQHVDQLLILAHANSDVQSLVADGKVAATNAVNAVRKHGDNAGAVLGEAVDKAKAAGKGKATAGAIKGKALPKKIVDELVETVDRALNAISGEARIILSTLEIRAGETIPTVDVPADVLVELFAMLDEVNETKAKQATRGQAAQVKRAQLDMVGGA